MSWLESLIRRLFVGDEKKLADASIERRIERLYGHSEVADFCKRLGSTQDDHLIGFTEEGPLFVPVERMHGVHRWVTGSTGSGKSAQIFHEEIDLIDPSGARGLVHVDVKDESARWFTDLFLPALGMTMEWDDAVDLIGGLCVVNPFADNYLPGLNILTPTPGFAPGLHAREVVGLVSEALGRTAGSFGPRMSGVLQYAVRAAIDIGNLSLFEVRALITRADYLQAQLRHIKDPDARDYFIYRFPSENRESVRAVANRLDQLLLPGTARILCARDTLDFSALIENPLTIINVGGAPRGAEFLTNWWLGIIVRGLARAIMTRPQGRHPVFCVLDEWWTALGQDLAEHFERLLSLARFKNVALWLINQLPSQVSSKSPSLLATIKNACGLQSAFRQSFEDARQLAYMLPTDPLARKLKDPLGPAWDHKPKSDSEQKRELDEELAHLPERHFWFYPKALGSRAIEMLAPTVPFEDAEYFAAKAPPALQELCRGQGFGYAPAQLDETMAIRRAWMEAVARGSVDCPSPVWDKSVHEIGEGNTSGELGDEPDNEEAPLKQLGTDTDSVGPPAATTKKEMAISERPPRPHRKTRTHKRRKNEPNLG
jgi:hypothetical protein